MPPAKILIVDDVPENLSVLFDFLIVQGFDVSIAPDGEGALEAAAEEIPDLILLDVMMPGIDGFETCRRLKAIQGLGDVPVIFMSALTDTLDKVKGFEVGAVDYVTKPVQQDEVLGRINAHVTIRRLQQKLQQRNLELDAFARMAAHDLKNPLGVVQSAVFLIKRDIPELPGSLASRLELIANSTKKMHAIIEGLLTLAGISHQPVVIESLSMGPMIAQILDRFGEMIRECKAEIRLPEYWPQAYGYVSWVEEVWTNYLSNALKYSGTPPCLELGATRQEGGVRFWVKDKGPGLSPEQQAKLFIPFSRLQGGRTEGHGLGLSIVRRIVEKLGGECGVESRPGDGCLFYFTLPSKPPLSQG